MIIIVTWICSCVLNTHTNTHFEYRLKCKLLSLYLKFYSSSFTRSVSVCDVFSFCCWNFLYFLVEGGLDEHFVVIFLFFVKISLIFLSLIRLNQLGMLPPNFVLRFYWLIYVSSWNMLWRLQDFEFVALLFITII